MSQRGPRPNHGSLQRSRCPITESNVEATRIKGSLCSNFLWRRAFDFKILNFLNFLVSFLNLKYFPHSNARLLFRTDKIFKILDHMLRIRLSFKTFFLLPLYSKLFWIKDTYRYTFPERMSLTDRDTPHRLDLIDKNLSAGYPNGNESISRIQIPLGYFNL